MEESQLEGIPVSSKLPCIQSTFHLLPGSVRLEEDKLSFSYSNIKEAEVICKFFVYEDGLGFVRDSRYSIPDLKFLACSGKNQRKDIRINREYEYDYSSSLPIVIEADSGDMIEISIIEIRNDVPKVLQQRLIKNKRMFEVREIINPPVEGMEEREINCVVCMTNVRNTIIEPCCHICICDHCANLMRTQVNRKCPMCRIGNLYLEVISFMKINFNS